MQSATMKYGQGLRNVLAVVVLVLGCLLAVSATANSDEPARDPQDTLISDYNFFDVTSMSLDEVGTFLHSRNPSLREWYIGEETAPTHILRIAEGVGVSPRALLLILETQTSLFEMDSEKSRLEAEQVLNEFIEALTNATKINGYLPNWRSPGDVIQLESGVVKPSNFATAFLYSLYPDTIFSQEFSETWSDRFAGIDQRASEPEGLSEDASRVAIADTFNYPMGSTPASGYLVTQEFNVYYSYYGKYHAAEDWTAIGYGTAGHSVYAIANGTVINRKFDGYPGGNVLIRHQLPSGALVYSHYGHVTPTVAIGQEVQKGQKIATIWPWTAADGRDNAHLHFEIRSSATGYGGAWTGAGYTPDDARQYGYYDPTGFIARHSYTLPAVVRVVNYTTPVRQTPSTSAPIVANLSIGQERTVIERQVNSRSGTGLVYGDTDGSVWYKVQYDPSNASNVGWVLGVEFFKGSYWASRFFLSEVGASSPPPPPPAVYFNETMGISREHADTVWWFPWFDTTGGRNVDILISNTGSQSSSVTVTVAGQAIQGSPYLVPAGGVAVARHANLRGGPVKIVSTNGQPLVVSQRVIFPETALRSNGVNTEEIPEPSDSLSGAALESIWWFPWYDDKNDFANWVLIGNPGSSPARVEVKIGGNNMPGSPVEIAPGDVWTPQFADVQGGPVVITSLNDQPIFASQRALRSGKKFSESLGIPNHLLDTVWWAPWYDANADRDRNDWILVGNPGPGSAQVEIYVANEKVGENSVAPETVWAPLYREAKGGPVKVISTNGQEIFVSKRTLWQETFDETMSMPNSYIDTTWWFPWYDDTATRAATFVVANAGTQTAEVELYIDGQKMTDSPASINPGSTWTPRYDTAKGGPVKIVSVNQQPIIVSQRVLFDSNVSFNEAIGIPEKLIYSQKSSLSIIKKTDPPGGMGFSFDGDLGGFVLDDGGQKDFGDLQAGIYSVTEGVPDGWETSTVTCDRANVITEQASVQISVEAGESVTCTFASKKTEMPPESHVYINPTIQEIPIDGGEFCVSVNAMQVADLGGFEFTFGFPTDLLQGSRVVLGPLLGMSGRTPVPLEPIIDNSAGTITYGSGSTGSNPGVNGAGQLASVCFEPQRNGDAELKFRQVKLADTLGSAMSSTHGDGLIKIRGSACFWADLDCNGVVDILDIQAVAGRWGAMQGDPNYTAQYDLDSDGDIDILDVQRIASQWGGPNRVHWGASTHTVTAPIHFAIDPSELKLAPGETKTIDLSVSSASNLAAFESLITYNPSLIEVKQVAFTKYLEQSGRTMLTVGPDIDGTKGEVRFGSVTFGTQPGVNGDGVVAMITLRAKSEGQTPLAIQSLQAADPEANPFLVNTSDGQIEVLAPITPGSYTLYLPVIERR